MAGLECATLYINLHSKLGKSMLVIVCERMSVEGLSELLFKRNLGKSLDIEEPAKRASRWLAYRCIIMLTGAFLSLFILPKCLVN